MIQLVEGDKERKLKTSFMKIWRVSIFVSVLVVSSCEGPAGPAGMISLVETSTEAAGMNCSNGGIRVTTGIDKNENGTIDIQEITSTKYICNGSNGVSTLLITTVEPKGTNCSNGGIKVQIGKDVNNDGQLGASEVEQIRYVCEGTNGVSTLLITTSEAKGINCPNGGTKVQFGKDLNNDGQLSTSEIEKVNYVCNGSNGVSSLVLLTQVTSNSDCSTGGVLIQSGLDINGNSNLDASEITQTNIVCNGAGNYPELRFEAGGISGFFGTPGGPNDSTHPSIKSLFTELNLSNYQGYDSIVYVVKGVRVHPIAGGGNAVYDKNVILEVVNMSSGNAIISGSKLTVTTGDDYVSGNFVSNIPSGTINLGFSIRSIDANFYGQIDKITLILRAKD
jgi:hypothetical protein